MDRSRIQVILSRVLTSLFFSNEILVGAGRYIMRESEVEEVVLVVVVVMVMAVASASAVLVLVVAAVVLAVLVLMSLFVYKHINLSQLVGRM